MPLARFLSNEKAALCVLALFLAGLGLVPWFLGDVESNETEKKIIAAGSEKSPVFRRGDRMRKAFPEELETNWIATVEYVPGAGSLEVDLRHRDIPVNPELKVKANFSAAVSRRPADGHWLSRQSNGIYRAGDVHLDPGKWTMGLTGYLRSNIAFRIEQVLDVK